MSTIALPSDQQAERPSIASTIATLRPQLQRALPKGMDADRVARLALTAVRKNPDLSRCTAESFAGALLTSSALGLEPDVNGEAYLVPYEDKRAQTWECSLIVGYQGYAKLFFQHPLARHLDAQAVHERDDFDYAYGLDPYLRHKPARGDRGPVTDYYAVAALSTGAKMFVVLTKDEVKALRGGKVGPSARFKGGDPQHWMERKTVLRQLLKLLPKSTALQRAMDAEERPGRELFADRVDERPAPAAIEERPANVDDDGVVHGQVMDDLPYNPADEPQGWQS
jgi:recombination protein RecT